MSTGRKGAAAVCAIAAFAAGAGAVLTRRMSEEGGTEAAAAGAAAAAQARAGAERVLAARTQTLETEVRSAAAIPQLRAALSDGVDAATLLDLFESEDWWAPFRSRSAALVTDDRILAMRAERQMPHPGPSLLARAQEAGHASGAMMGARPSVVALVPMSGPRNAEPTFLMFASPIDLAELQAAVGVPLLLSDGHAAVASAGGGPAQQAVLAGLPGRESAGTVRDPNGSWLAAAAPLSPKLWLWTLHPIAAASGPPTLAVGLAAGAALLALCALVLGLVKRGAPSPVAIPLAEGASTERRRRGTLSYDTGEVAQRPTAMADQEGAAVPVPAPYSSPRLRTAQAGGGVAVAVAPARVEVTSSTFGRYRLLERLGEGGMAEIYTAVLHGAEGFRRVFVVKRLRPQVARNRAAVEQFIDEAKLGSTLVHPNIVPVFDFGKVGDEYFMAQEYVVGRDITRVLQRHMERMGRPMDERLVLYFAHEVLDALAYAHNQTDNAGAHLGLVHRDISPGNIMITARGEVKLFDFGIVKAEGRLSKTEVGVVKGNVSFMSPEQARGHAVDARSDLFSLGLVMYYALTNDALYPGESTFDQLMKAASGPRTEHLQRVQALPPVSASVLARALAVDPAHRYQNAAEFEAELVPHVTGAKAEAVNLMQRLFGPEFRRETTL
jgi:hypothetical protein